MMKQLLIVSGFALMATIVLGAAPESGGKELLDAAMNRLKPLVGTWKGPGFLCAAAGGEKLSFESTWVIQPAYDGRYLRLEFTIAGPQRSTAWTGYFTFDETKGEYRTVWTGLESGYQFKETGTFDGGGALTLVSHQKDGPGPDAKDITVTSVFTVAPDGKSFTCVDTRKLDSDGAGAGWVSLSTDAKRVSP